MTWYKTGTVSVTQGNNAVIGAGTSFIANSRVGDAFRGPDGEWYEVTNIASDIALSIAPNYQGEPVSGGIYSLAPMQGYVKDSADALRAATSVIASSVADMQEQVTAATEAAATAVQAEAVAVAKTDIATAAADLSTQNKESTSQDATSAGQAALRAEAARDAAVGSEEVAAASAQAAAESAEEAEMVTRGKAASGANSDITSLSGLTTALSMAQGGTGSKTGVPTMVGATASTAGIKGLVPASVAGDQAKFLRADGTWQVAGFSKNYSSANTAFTNGGLVVFAHGLGEMPKVSSVHFTPFPTDQTGWTAGINVAASSFTLGMDAVNIYVQIASGGLNIYSAVPGTLSSVAPGAWRCVARASA